MNSDLRNPRIIKGSVLFEFALALPIAITLLLGAYNIGKIAHVANVLNESVKKVNQNCIAPVDSDCSLATPLSPTDALYRWDKTNLETPRSALVPLVRYSAPASFVEIPSYLLFPEVNVLSKVSFTQVDQVKSWKAVRPVDNGITPTTTTPYYIINPNKPGFPYVGGSAGSPTFYTDSSGTTEYPPQINHTGNSNDVNISTSSNSWVYINESFTFEIPSENAPADSTCFLNLFGGPGCAHPSWPGSFTTCEDGSCNNYTYTPPNAMKQLNEEAYISLQVAVKGSTSNINTKAAIQMVIEQGQGSSLTRRNLDGFGGINSTKLTDKRTFNFAPRGLSCDRYLSGYSSNYKPGGAEKNTNKCPSSSAVDYNQAPAIKVTRGVPIRLRFRVKVYDGNGTAKIYLHRAKIWYRDYLKKNHVQVNTNYDPDPAVVQLDCADSLENATTQLASIVGQNDTDKYTITQTGDLLCGEAVTLKGPFDCPPPGSNGNFSADLNNGPVVCSIEKFITGAGSAENINWESAWISLKDAPDIAMLGLTSGMNFQQYCGSVPQIDPSYLNFFSEVRLPPQDEWQHLATDEKVFTGPDEYESNEALNCYDLSTMNLDHKFFTELPNSSPLNENGIPQLGCNWQEEILNYLAVNFSHIVPPSAIGTPEINFMGRVMGIPVDECVIPYWTEANLVNSSTTTCAFTHDSSIPACCTNINPATEFCVATLHSFTPATPEEGSATLSQELLSQYAFKELKGGLPAAAKCQSTTGSDCFDINFDLSTPNQSTVNGFYNLKLFGPSLLGFTDPIIRISRSHTIKLERNLVTN